MEQVCADIKPALQILNRLLDAEPVVKEQFGPWWQEVGWGGSVCAPGGSLDRLLGNMSGQVHTCGPTVA